VERRGVGEAAIAAALALVALGCASTIDAATVREELVRQTGRVPVGEFEWNLGLTARLALGALGTKPADVLAIPGLTGLEVALYDLDPAAPGAGAPLDLSAIDRRGWETVVRFRDARSSALVVIQPAGDRIGELVLVGSGGSQVLFARLTGLLDPGLPEELGDSIAKQGPAATKDALVGAAAPPP
jgi:hypothetical protein